jgi:hypothetical protein
LDIRFEGRSRSDTSRWAMRYRTGWAALLFVEQWSRCAVPRSREVPNAFGQIAVYCVVGDIAGETAGDATEGDVGVTLHLSSLEPFLSPDGADALADLLKRQARMCRERPEAVRRAALHAYR